MSALYVRSIGHREHVVTSSGLVIGCAHVPEPARLADDEPVIQAALLAPLPPPLYLRAWLYFTQPVR